MNREPDKPAGIKEIATQLGISIGTVDRALHGRPGVSAKTQARVLKLAESLSYRPNLAARNLKLNRSLRIAVHTPEQIASFFDPLRAGIRMAATAAHALRVELDFREFPRLGSGDEAALEQLMTREYDGVILTPGDPAKVDRYISLLAERGVAVVCVASDSSRADRIAGVHVDSSVSGGIAAEMLGTAVCEKGRVAIITGSFQTLDHAEKVRGFAATLATLAPHLTLVPTLENHEDENEAYEAAKTLLASEGELRGLYVNTANSLPVLRALGEQKRSQVVRVITTDLFPELVPRLSSGEVLATLYQRPFTQGRIAFETLVRYLADGVRPTSSIRLAPHIVLRSNLSLFLDRLRT